MVPVKEDTVEAVASHGGGRCARQRSVSGDRDLCDHRRRAGGYRSHVDPTNMMDLRKNAVSEDTKIYNMDCKGESV